MLDFEDIEQLETNKELPSGKIDENDFERD